MAEKLTIERYKLAHGKQHCDIFSDDLDIATVYEEKYVHLLAASPLMLEALEAAREYVINTTTDCRECGEPNSSSSRDKTIDIIDAAIAAAKGE